jgi:hypothetical protein
MVRLLKIRERIVRFSTLEMKIGSVGYFSSSNYYSTGCKYHNFQLKNIPVVTYSNADTLKAIILKDNKDKAGVYLWTNLING